MIERQLHLLSASRMPTSYPLQLSAEEVAAWLNGYAALWHPAALAEASQSPQASSSYDHDYPQTGFIYCVPKGPQLFQPDDWRDRVVNASAIVFEATADRRETQNSLLAAVQDVVLSAGAGPESPDANPQTLILRCRDLPDSIVRDFQAVGFGHLLLDNLFEASDHVRLLDAAGFWSDVTAAVQSLNELVPVQPQALEKSEVTVALAQSGEGTDGPAAHRQTYRDHLRSAAEKLQAAREQIHSMRMHWVDFAQINPEAKTAQWPLTLKKGMPLCVTGSGEAFEQLAQGAPEKLEELKERFRHAAPAKVDLCCGAYREREDALLPIESQIWNLESARSTVRELLGQEPSVYARRTSAFHPQLPGWLQHMGYRHAVLISQDGALIPTIRSTAVNWPGPDGKAVDAYCRAPLPAHDPLSFFNLVYHMYQAYSSDAAPTIAFVHTEEPAFDSYGDLVTLTDLLPVFGNFTNLSEYFTDATSGDYIGTQPADEFFADYLDERVTKQKHPNPVSAFARHFRLRRKLDSAFTLAALHRAVTPNPGTEDEKRIAELTGIERNAEVAGAHVPASAVCSEQLEPLETTLANKLAERLQTRAAANRPGFIAFNTCGFTRRVALELPGVRGPIPVADAVKAAEFTGELARLVVEIPPLGYVWFPREGPPGTPQPRERLKLAQNLTVRNEFFECDVDAGTGGIRSFRDLRSRATRFGQQLVYNPGSRMVARSVTVTNSGTALGEITSTGDLVDDRNEVLATFRQRLRAWLGRPVLEVRIELDVKHRPTGYPWHAFYGARFGWRDERAVLFRGVNGVNAQTGYTRPVSPDYLEVRLGGERSFLFTGGLPFLQRHGSRLADVVLVPEGETETSFDLLIAADRDLPMQTAQGWVTPVPLVETSRGPPHFGASTWLGHVDMPSLLLTSLKPAAAAEGVNRAITARFVESAGFGGTAELRLARDPTRAALVDGMGKPTQPLSLLGDAVQMEYSANETLRVLLEWV